MSSLCIKTNNEDILKYLQNEFKDFNMLNVFYSCNEFKNYKNIIIHYKGVDNELFYTKLATIFSYLVIDNFENKIVKNILLSNYFYFDNYELEKILELCEENICDDSEFSFQNRQMLLFDAFYDYISTHKSIILTGFINFRLTNYRNLLNELIDFSVNEFIIEKEYLEFVSLLKLYINSQIPLTPILHLVSSDFGIIILDKDLNIVEVNKNIENTKYLSDISFSENDYVLNTIINLLPKKIFLHLPKISINNFEFINTLKLIFENRIEICNDCNICNLYKNINSFEQKREFLKPTGLKFSVLLNMKNSSKLFDKY